MNAHYPTQAELAQQREQFALDSDERRPWHALAHARVVLGQPWNHTLWLYWVERDLAKWCEALRWRPRVVEVTETEQRLLHGDR